MLHCVVLLQNALLVSTAVQPFASLLGQADTALNYSFNYFWWTLSLIVNFMALYSSVFILRTVLAMPKDANHLQAFVENASKGFFKALALPAFFTVLEALVAMICRFHNLLLYPSSLGVLADVRPDVRLHSTADCVQQEG